MKYTGEKRQESGNDGFLSLRLLLIIGIVLLCIAVPFVLQKIRDSQVVEVRVAELRAVFAEWKRLGSPTGEGLESYVRERVRLQSAVGQSFSFETGLSIKGLFASTNLPGISGGFVLVDDGGQIYFGREGRVLKLYGR